MDDLQDMQFKCNDAFGEMHLDSDEKGNIEGTVCSQLKDKKNEILNRFNNSKLGGNKKYKKNKRKKTLKKFIISKKNKKNVTRKI